MNGAVTILHYAYMVWPRTTIHTDLRSSRKSNKTANDSLRDVADTRIFC